VIAWKPGGKASLPAVVKRPAGVVQVEPTSTSQERIAEGQALYSQHCFRCHGMGTRSGGVLPDLRFSSRETHAHWNDIVLGGIRADRGMASFADVIGPADATAIQAYVIAQAYREPSWLESAASWLSERGACLPASWVVD
jgi:quinohemoprotein ethanol dehydrogenase